MLSVRHLARSIDQGATALPIIADVDFAARDGKFLSMVGPSGCGKTTLLTCLAGLAPVSGGSIGFLGAPLVGPAPIISVVFQDYSRSLLPWKSNLDNVVFGVRRVGDASRREKRERADLKSKFARPRRWGEPGFEPSVPLRRKALPGIANRRRRHDWRNHLQAKGPRQLCLSGLAPIAFPFAEGPTVRFHLPPANSHQRTSKLYR